ncbi:MAG: hypothetical protein ACM3JH_08170 [Acidithiobacillales bacterium]
MKRRGFALVAVMGVLAFLLLVLSLLAKLLSDDLAATRRRGNAAYARELSRSGLAYARAAIARGGGLAPETFDVEGGRIEIRPDVTDAGLRVVSVGTVLSGGMVLARRAAAFDPGEVRRELEEPPSPSVPAPEEPAVLEEPPTPETVTPVPAPGR